ncbi:three component ABC system middle component [Marinicellulosiphila megalodicopiae]|uniref:three component ABC system middle component n=1 Tax=Marinicellulosiphila megalodicopiae TaxID=2724896 RepID=UPI003BB1D0F1
MNLASAFSSEEQNLFNPAYVGTILYHAIRECQTKNSKGLHCSLPYLLVPLALSNRYSQILPKHITTPLAGWFSDNEGTLVGFPSSVNAFIDITNTALYFLLNNGAIILEADGFLNIVDDRLAKNPSKVKNNSEFKHGFQSAGFLGRWFSCAGSAEVIYSQLGVTP